MLLIWGSRNYGRVGEHAGQYQVTRFGHLWFVPLVPIGSSWILGYDDQEEVIGHKARWSLRSVLAGYLRVWGPVIAVPSAAQHTTTGWIMGGVAALLTLWSWTWRGLRDPLEQKRREMHAALWNTACPAEMLPRQLADSLRADADQLFAERCPGRTPEDVARLGAADPEQARLAYASLALAAARAKGLDRQRLRAAADKLLDAPKPATAADPYRATAVKIG